MVKLKLTLSAELTNLTDLSPSDPDTYNYFFKVQCSGCREVHDNWVGISKTDERSMTGGRGTANFVYKCQFCSKEASATFVVPNAKAPASIYSRDAQSVTLCVLDCRGCEFTEFDPRGQWTCKGAETKSVFTEIEFEDGEWHDYDEAAGLPVSVTNIKVTSHINPSASRCVI
ncbi:hypothetical protein CROQUDRAFT_74982 [Cronartium quercuum f. sp. fusiforme G11]|uniref:DUF866-domain-containing protein n=1 Tax=Cronartium quercuum f. sp. fusiforme G11 TaxID=708437 RepID=A0A9P6TEF7_9BASI|nr:hypothetical protein CROQUDRAFT_74982 [Cronartium quercuum f. sp. fusiforme G11]